MATRAICPACGAETSPGQEYCLECGERLTGPPVVTSATLRQRFPLLGETWFVPALVGFLVVGIAAALAIHYLDKPDRTKTFVATAPNTFIITRGGTSLSFSAPPKGATAQQQPQPSTQQRVVGSWPAGRSSGYTVVLVSLPRSGGRPQALSIARRALLAGLPLVGIIDSARFASLHPGYLVVFSGVYDTETAARQALGQAHAQGFAAAYVRQVSR